MLKKVLNAKYIDLKIKTPPLIPPQGGNPLNQKY